MHAWSSSIATRDSDGDSKGEIGIGHEHLQVPARRAPAPTASVVDEAFGDAVEVAAQPTTAAPAQLEGLLE